MNPELFRMSHGPISKYLKNKGDFGSIYKISESNKSFKLALNNNTRNRIKPLEHIKKGLVLLSVLTMAKMYDLRTGGYGGSVNGVTRLGDDKTMKYIEKLGVALVNHIGKLGTMVQPRALEESFRKHNEQLSSAFMTDFAYVMRKYKTFNGKFFLKHWRRQRQTSYRESQVSGLALYQYLYKYKNVYKQYMNSLGSLNMLNHNNNNLKREFTLKRNYITEPFQFSNSNLDSMLMKLNMPVLGNASTTDPVASMQALISNNRPNHPNLAPPFPRYPPFPPFSGNEGMVEGVLNAPRRTNNRHITRYDNHTTRVYNNNQPQFRNNRNNVTNNFPVARRPQPVVTNNNNNNNNNNQQILPQAFFNAPTNNNNNMNNQPQMVNNNQRRTPNNNNNYVSQQYSAMRQAVRMNRKNLEQNLANRGYYSNVNNVQWTRRLLTKNGKRKRND